MGKLYPFLLATLALAGCADEEDEVARYPQPAHDEIRCVELPRATPDDSFALAQAASEATKPPPYRPRSVSLGFAGDGVLSGGVTRDTPVYIDQAPQEPQYIPYPQYAPYPPYCPGCSQRYPQPDGFDPPYPWTYRR